MCPCVYRSMSACLYICVCMCVRVCAHPNVRASVHPCVGGFMCVYVPAVLLKAVPSHHVSRHLKQSPATLSNTGAGGPSGCCPQGWTFQVMGILRAQATSACRPPRGVGPPLATHTASLRTSQDLLSLSGEDQVLQPHTIEAPRRGLAGSHGPLSEDLRQFAARCTCAGVALLSVTPPHESAH